MKSAEERFDRLIQFRLPGCLLVTVDAEAKKRLISRADYIRGALLDRLNRDIDSGKLHG